MVYFSSHLMLVRNIFRDAGCHKFELAKLAFLNCILSIQKYLEDRDSMRMIFRCLSIRNICIVIKVYTYLK